MPDKLTDAQIENLRKSAYVHGTPPVFGDQITSALDELQTLRAENERLLRLLPYAVALEARSEAAQAENATLRSHLRTCVAALSGISTVADRHEVSDYERLAEALLIADSALTPEVQAAAKEGRG